MRILHELNQLDIGGAERVIDGIVKHDKKNHHTVYAYKDGPMRKILEKSGAKVIVEDPKKEHALEADIIHIHTGGGESRIATAVNGSIPIVETVHSPIVSAVRDEFVTCRVGVSGTVSAKNRKCRTIYNGVDVDRLNLPCPEFADTKARDSNEPEKVIFDSCRKHLGIPYDAFVIGRLGRIGFDKCIEEFLVTCKLAQEPDFNREIHVLIVGDETKGSRGHLAKSRVMAASLPVKNVHFLPSLEEVGWAYDAMDLFLYPSPGEGFCLVIAEAMACGVPVITWNTDLTRELFMGCALLADNTIESLKKNVIYLMTHEAIRTSFAGMGSKRVTGMFTSEIMSEQYQALYDEVQASGEQTKCQDTTTSSPSS